MKERCSLGECVRGKVGNWIEEVNCIDIENELGHGNFSMQIIRAWLPAWH